MYFSFNRLLLKKNAFTLTILPKKERRKLISNEILQSA